MPELPPLARQLEKELLALGDDSMLLDELDGFIAGLLVCPELIMPKDWFPVVWHGDSASEAAVFDDVDHANRVVGLLMEYYNHVARTLMERPAHYGPLFTVDSRSDEVIWEVWMSGFKKAVALRPAAWKELLNADAETAAAMTGMLQLAEIACGDNRMEPDDPIMTAAPDVIGDYVVILNAWRFANYRPIQDAASRTEPAFGKKVGRNERCPCGSGKKYKRCCGLN